MSNVKIEICDWIDLHRICMASRKPSMDAALDRAALWIRVAKSEIENRCFSTVQENVDEAITELNIVLTAMLESADFALTELSRRRSVENPED